MEAAVETLVGLVVMGVLLTGAIGFIAWRGSRQNEAWAEIGDALGLQFSPGGLIGYPVLVGEIDGIRVEVGVEEVGGSRNKKVFTAVHGEIDADLPRGMAIAATSSLSFLESALGGQDLDVGDPEVDEALVIRGEVPVLVREWFEQPAALEAARRLARCGYPVTVRGDLVSVRLHGFVGGELLQAVIESVAAMTLAVQHAAGGPRRKVQVQRIPDATPLDPRLVELASGGLSPERRTALLDELAEVDLVFDARIAQVPALPGGDRSGEALALRVVSATARGANLLLRYGPSWNDYLDALDPGAIVPVQGRAVSWNVAEQRVVVDISD